MLLHLAAVVSLFALAFSFYAAVTHTVAAFLLRPSIGMFLVIPAVTALCALNLALYLLLAVTQLPTKPFLTWLRKPAQEPTKTKAKRPAE